MEALEVHPTLTPSVVQCLKIYTGIDKKRIFKENTQ